MGQGVLVWLASHVCTVLGAFTGFCLKPVGILILEAEIGRMLKSFDVFIRDGKMYKCANNFR